MRIIGFSGYARSGKDTAAEALMSLGFVRIGFADKLKDFVYYLNPKVDGGPMGDMTVREVIDKWGWEGYKNTYWGESIRERLQYIGTECGRKILGENVWVDAAFNNLPDGKYVFSDVRFPNEVDGIRSRGGKIYRIERAGVDAVNQHISETALDHYEFDGFIHNDGTLAQFQDSVRRKSCEGWY